MQRFNSIFRGLKPRPTMAALVESLSGGTLILAPHPDDAALSVGGCLAGRLLPEPVTILTVFGRSNFANGRFHTHHQAVTHWRRQEEENYAAAVGVRLRLLEEPEATLREDAELFVTQGRVKVPRKLAERVGAEVAAVAPGLLLAPLGIGHHHDHLLLCQVARQLVGTAVAFYDDLPYAAGQSRRTIRRRAQRVDAGLQAVRADIAPYLKAKLAALHAYPSQLDDADIAAVGRHARRWPEGVVEQLWLNVSRWPQQ